MKRITAQQARELTEYEVGKEPTVTIGEIYEAILSATEKGCETLFFIGVISNTTIRMLHEDGYIVKIEGGIPSNIYISWN